jgi:hypothetical protein
MLDALEIIPRKPMSPEDRSSIEMVHTGLIRLTSNPGVSRLCEQGRNIAHTIEAVLADAPIQTPEEMRRGLACALSYGPIQ